MWFMMNEWFWDKKTGLPWFMSAWKRWLETSGNAGLSTFQMPPKATSAVSKPKVAKTQSSKKSAPLKTVKSVAKSTASTAKTVKATAKKEASNAKTATATEKSVAAPKAMVATKTVATKKPVAAPKATAAAKKSAATTKTTTATKTVATKKPVATSKATTAVAPMPKKAMISNGKLTVHGKSFLAQINSASSKGSIREAITLLCSQQEWVERDTLANALKHKPEQLDILHLTPMVNAGVLCLKHPENLKHPEQAYGLVKK
ncbi:MAG: hypothetical protein J6V99_05405 [Neisseriaceae bacterium]|nr:hypothetical protein [Neisseriaceae bacterium]